MILNIKTSICLLIISLISLITPAHALSIEGFDLLDITVNGSVQYDDNLFRLPEVTPATANGISSRSDRISFGRVGLALDKSYGLQRWKLDANLSRYRYARNGFLNYGATNYSALWMWQLTSSVKGNVSFDRSQQPVNFSDYTNYTQKNIRTNETQRFDVDWTVTGGWHGVAAVSELNQENSTLFTTEASYKQRALEAGLNYQFSSGSSMSLIGRNAEGTYLDRALNPAALLDTEFNQKEMEANLRWLLTGKTTLNARMSYLSRQHPNFAQRDYSGLVGNLDYVWNITGKILLNGRLERTLSAFQDFDSSYYVNRQFTITPVWLITDKVNTRLALSSSWQNYRGSIRAVPAQERRDRLNNYQLSINWKPTDNIDLTGSLQRQQRSSPLFQSREFTDQITGVNAQLRF